MENNLFYASLCLDDLTINSVLNEMKHFKTNNIDVHIHSFNEIFAVIKGELNVNLYDGRLKLLEGSVCIIPAGVFHYSSVSDDAIVISIRFELLNNKQTKKSGLYNDFLTLISGCQPLTISDETHGLCAGIKDAYQEFLSPTIATDIYVKALLTQFYLDVYRNLKKIEKKDTKSQTSMQTIDADSDLRLRIEKLLLQRFADKVTVEDFAKELHFSTRHLSRVINKFYGKSFKALLIDFRLERSVHLLINSDETIEEIACSCGYPTLKNFNLAFNKKYKTSPKNFRKIKNGIRKS